MPQHFAEQFCKPEVGKAQQDLAGRKPTSSMALVPEQGGI